LLHAAMNAVIPSTVANSQLRPLGEHAAWR
jgi:hypothetical protein